MKRIMLFALLVLFLFSLTNVHAQLSRKAQWEIFAGGAIPLAPEGFKDYFKVGFSGHGQYVIFPSPKLGITFGLAAEGFTFDDQAFMEDFGFIDSGVTVEGSASVVELGVGVRPYLSPVESNSQVFLFGMGTYNVLTWEATVTGPLAQEDIKTEENKFGVATGAGVEMPAGDKFNIILQGVFRFIFTEEETTSFLGITAGLVF